MPVCDVCKRVLEGMWGPSNLGILKDQPWYQEVLDGWKYFSEPWSDGREDHMYAYAHHSTREALLESQNDGCAICDQCSDLQDNYEMAAPDHFSVVWIQVTNTDNRVAALLVYIRYGGRTKRVDLSIASPNPNYGFDQATFPNFNMGSSTSDDKTWTQIKKWWTHCLEFHHSCNILTKTNYMPHQILEITESETAKEPLEFRLVSGEHCPPGSSYMTLSYCWGQQAEGGQVVYRLLTSTENQLRTWQPVSVLPKTLRQALEAARRLGSRYLWIDRLCIIQDSDEDWAREAILMGDIYKHATLSIAALGAANDQDGLFWDRDISRILPTVMKIRTKHQGKVQHFVAIDDMKNFTWGTAGLPFNEEATLISRAWVLQERLLAPRVVYFGQKQVFWECTVSQCSEILPESRLSQHQSENANQICQWKQPIGHGVIPRNTKSISYETLFEDWDYITGLYSESNLTVANDKLVALSGLANEMRLKLIAHRPKQPHRYLAGLWEERLPLALLWAPKYWKKSPCWRAPEYRAPSWSWASLDGPIGLPWVDPSDMIISSVLSWEILLAGDTDTGQVKGGSITLTGPTIGPAAYDAPAAVYSAEVYEVMVYRKTTQSCWRSKTREKGADEVETLTVHLDTAEEVLGELVHLMIQESEMTKPKWLCKGLALTKHGQGGDVYRRVGMAVRTFRSHGDMEEYIMKCPRETVTII